MDGLLGAVFGAVAAAVVTIILRLFAVPAEIARHDRQVTFLAEDLERWVVDDHRRLQQDLDRVKNAYAAPGQQNSGAYGRARTEATTVRLQRYRDRRSATERQFAELLAAEWWPHDLWRRLRRRGPLQLASLAQAERVVTEWRMSGLAQNARMFDPTTYGIEDLLRHIGA